MSNGLRRALVLIKRKQQKGKRLNIFGEKSAGPLLISPTKLGQLKALHDDKEKAKMEKEREKELRKEQAKEEKIRKEVAKRKKSLQYQVALQLRRKRKRLEDK